jgi:hypothetical protein
LLLSAPTARTRTHIFVPLVKLLSVLEDLLLTSLKFQVVAAAGVGTPKP